MSLYYIYSLILYSSQYMYAYYNVCKQQKAFYVEINMYLNNL